MIRQLRFLINNESWVITGHIVLASDGETYGAVVNEGGDLKYLRCARVDVESIDILDG